MAISLLGLPSQAAELVLSVSRSVLSLPLYVAEAQGGFREAGLDLRIRECRRPHRPRQ